MANNIVKLVTQVGGTVEAIRAVLGVVTDNYNDLVNKPSINGVVLRGDMNLETLNAREPAGPSVYLFHGETGDAETICPQELDIYTYRRNLQLGDLILTKDGKIYEVDRVDVPGSSDGSHDADSVYYASLFLDLQK